MNDPRNASNNTDFDYALFDSAEVISTEDSEHFYAYVGMRTSKVALVKCLQELKKHRAATGATMDIVGLSEDHGEHIVTVEVDFGPANKIAVYSRQAVVGWHCINEITKNMHRLQPRLCTQPHFEESDRLGLMLRESPVSPDDTSHSDIDRLLLVLLGREGVSTRHEGLTPTRAKSRVQTGQFELLD